MVGTFGTIFFEGFSFDELINGFRILGLTEGFFVMLLRSEGLRILFSVAPELLFCVVLGVKMFVRLRFELDPEDLIAE